MMRNSLLSRLKNNTSDRLFFFIIYAISVFAFVVTLYPFVYITSVSISSQVAVSKGQVYLWPIGFSLNGYRYILSFSAIWRAYGNTIFVVLVGTALNMIATVLTAYPLSRRSFSMRRFFNFFIVFSMYFSGGLIPVYLIVTSLGLYNSRWSLIIPILVSSYNIMICRSAFSAIPDEVIESAYVDGANDMNILKSIAIHLVTPTLAVLALYYAVAHWNNFFSALLYISDQTKVPLQIVLRRILIMSSQEVIQDALLAAEDRAIVSVQIRYVTIIVSTLPILMIYPFLQKYFVKGIMLGAVKG